MVRGLAARLRGRGRDRDQDGHGADTVWLWHELLVPALDALGWRDIPMPVRGDAAQPASWPGPGVSAFLRIQGRRALLVHAMHSAASLTRAADALFPLRRRAWSADAPLLLVASVRELAVYDCRVKPVHGDRARVARVLHLPRDAYAARWSAIAGLLSPAAVTRVLDQPGKRRSMVTVTAALVDELETWCCDLVSRAARHDPRADDDALERAARRALDRILFLCLCEARGIVPRGRLRALCDRAQVDLALAALYRDTGRDITRDHDIAFPGQDDALPGSPDMPAMDDATLAAIIQALHAPASPYDFSVLSPEILGSVYEHSLTRRLRLIWSPGRSPDRSPGRDPGAPRVVMTARPGARKASGTYYTPRHIVDHVVARTVGAFLDGKTPQEAREIRILDPACGAGSFLLGAYRFLLRWHRQAHLRADRPGDHGSGDRANRDANGAWRLTTRERVRILVRNLHGVDIDPRAVERTGLSLLVIALADPDVPAGAAAVASPAAPSPAPARDHAGTARRMAIHCGNALVAPDFLAEHGRDMDAAAAQRVNVFDWARAFPRALDGARPGFDVVLGNPPWGQKGIMEQPAVKAYVRHRFPSVKGHYDLFRPFVEQGIRLLRRDVGRFGMVLPDIVLLKDYQETRRYLLDHLSLTHIDWWGRAFRPAVIDAATIVGVKRAPAGAHAVQVALRPDAAAAASAGPAQGSPTHAISQADFRANERYVFNITLTPERRAVIDRLARGPRVGDFFEAHEGVHSGNMRAALFVPQPLDASCRPLLLGRDEITPYGLRWAGRFIRLGAVPPPRRRPQRGERYAHTGRHEWFHADKLLVRRTGDHVLAAVDRQGRYASNNFFVVLPKAPCALGLDGLCALLNSRLMTWYFRAVEPRKGRAFAELKIKHLSAFPLPAGVGAAGEDAIDQACAALERLGAERRELAHALLAVRADPQADAGPGDGPGHGPDDGPGRAEQMRALERRRDVLDREIERAVHAMFAIRDEEMRIIEST